MGPTSSPGMSVAGDRERRLTGHTGREPYQRSGRQPAIPLTAPTPSPPPRRPSRTLRSPRPASVLDEAAVVVIHALRESTHAADTEHGSGKVPGAEYGLRRNGRQSRAVAWLRVGVLRPPGVAHGLTVPSRPRELVPIGKTPTIRCLRTEPRHCVDPYREEGGAGVANPAAMIVG